MSSWISSSFMYTTLKYAAGAGVVGSTLLASALYYYQCSLIYPAYMPSGSRINVPTPTEFVLPYEDVTLTTPDGLKIKGYVIPARKTFVPSMEVNSMGMADRKKRGLEETEKWAEEIGTQEAIDYARSKPTVVIFHANAGNMGHRIPIARKFNTDLGCNVFMLSYRGYGLSEGTPSEHGMRIDVDTAMEYVAKHPLLEKTKIILFGQSIGGAVCLYAGQKFSSLVSGIIIENTFVSLQSLIPHVMPQLPKALLPLLLTERWDAAKAIPHIPPQTPILFLSGLRDELVPPSQMVELKKMREGGRNRWREFNGQHNDTFLCSGYWKEVEDWMKEEVLQ